MLQPILGIISFIGAIVIFSSTFVEGNLILTASLAALILIEGVYHLLKKNVIKGGIKLASTITLTISIFFRLPFYLSFIVGIALLVVALYDVFPTIIGKE